jgi:hypothetical protein
MDSLINYWPLIAFGLLGLGAVALLGLGVWWWRAALLAWVQAWGWAAVVVLVLAALVIAAIMEPEAGLRWFRRGSFIAFAGFLVAFAALMLYLRWQVQIGSAATALRLWWSSAWPRLAWLAGGVATLGLLWSQRVNEVSNQIDESYVRWNVWLRSAATLIIIAVTLWRVGAWPHIIKQLSMLVK